MPPESETESETGGSHRKLIYLKIGAVAGVGGAVMTIIVVVLIVVLTRKGRSMRFVGDDANALRNNQGVDMRSFLFDLDVLIAATDNFSTKNMLGRGGFGTVYKGRLQDGREIAVKKLATNSMQGKEEFENEVRVLLKMQHRNLVQLFGCCVQERERILVYEYLPNKSLDKFLFDKSKSAILDWPKRLNIIMGVARGLLYLHRDSVLRIIHRDIKASNILLDHQMNPKISDFGLAKLFHDEQSRHRTRQIAGTLPPNDVCYIVNAF
ncbi:Receptor-like serine-threonine protein kinase [Citrus sinensis]|uniref:Receptor-like serine-threonine protein kinase n=1 Tax=Citrus sinensis TaxID=2711 RepID=A0ACB8K2I7_CITSI|nr:Receptor-like serine-threonine protein kinase [Citrus sinensis]